MELPENISNSLCKTLFIYIYYNLCGKHKNNIVNNIYFGVSPSGKALVFDTNTQRFESFYSKICCACNLIG